MFNPAIIIQFFLKSFYKIKIKIKNKNQIKIKIKIKNKNIYKNK